MPSPLRLDMDIYACVHDKKGNFPVVVGERGSCMTGQAGKQEGLRPPRPPPRAVPPHTPASLGSSAVLAAVTQRYCACLDISLLLTSFQKGGSFPRERNLVDVLLIGIGSLFPFHCLERGEGVGRGRQTGDARERSVCLHPLTKAKCA